MLTRTVDEVCQLEHTTNLKELRSFHVLCNVFRRFVPNFDGGTVPFNENLWKGQPQDFDSLSHEKTTARETLKAKLMEPPVLALPRSQGNFTVDTYACDKQIACVLLET